MGFANAPAHLARRVRAKCDDGYRVSVTAVTDTHAESPYAAPSGTGEGESGSRGTALCAASSPAASVG